MNGQNKTEWMILGLRGQKVMKFEFSVLKILQI